MRSAVKTDWKKGDKVIHVCVMQTSFTTEEFIVGDCDGRHVWALAPSGTVCGMPAYPVSELISDRNDVLSFVLRTARHRIEQATELLRHIESKEGLREEGPHTKGSS